MICATSRRAGPDKKQARADKEQDARPRFRDRAEPDVIPLGRMLRQVVPRAPGQGRGRCWKRRLRQAFVDHISVDGQGVPAIAKKASVGSHAGRPAPDPRK